MLVETIVVYPHPLHADHILKTFSYDLVGLYAFVLYTIRVRVHMYEHLYGVCIHGGQWYKYVYIMFSTGNRYL